MKKKKKKSYILVHFMKDNIYGFDIRSGVDDAKKTIEDFKSKNICVTECKYWDDDSKQIIDLLKD